MTDALLEAIRSNDAAAVRDLLERQPDLKARLDEALPQEGFGETPLIAAVQQGNRDMIDVLLRAGASVNRKSHWWAGGFHAIDNASADPALIAFLIERGATPEIHQLVHLDRLDDVRSVLERDPGLIRARGGDGQLPLHFARTRAMADLLLDRGADIDAIDVDHESTAAQWMVRERQDVARHLVARGGRTDILMAAAFGDEARLARMLDEDPAAIRTTVSERYFPKRDARAGGSIYNWTLGTSKSAHEIAREFGHEGTVRLLLERTPDDMKLSVACEMEDEALVRRLIAGSLDLVRTGPAGDRRKLADAARNNKTAAVRLMLEAGWPVDIGGQHNATALHWAGFHGNVDMARMLIAYHAPLEARDADFDGTPLNWTIHGSQHGWRSKTGDYVGTATVLLEAGAAAPPIDSLKTGTPEVLEVLRRRASR